MANIIKPKRSNTAAKVPNTTELTSGELGVNMADRKVYINNGTAVVQVGAGNLSGLGDVAITTPTNGQALTYNSTTSKWQNSTAGTGTVTSVGGTGTVSGLSLSGTVTTSGNLTLGGTLAVTPSNFASQTANTVLAAPNGTAGVPTFRAIVAADIPTLNQNTTGTAANVTGTVAVANGGTGATTAAAARTNLGATTLGGNLYTLANVAAIAFPRFNADNTVSSLDAASFRTAIGAGTSSTTGTVTSVGGTGTVSGLTLTGTVTTSGNLTLGGTLAVTPSNFASQTANTFLAAPNAAAGVPTFRTIVASDVPTLNQNTTGSAATLATGRTIAMTGDVTYTSGSFNGSANVTGVATLANSGVTAGTYTKVTVNAKGLTTSGTTLAASDIPELTMAKLPGAAYKQSVRCATTANLTATATTTTLTNSSTLAALVLDGITVATNDRVLVKDQTTAAQNGIYTVTNVGSASVAWVLTRTADADAADEIGAAVVNVDSGTANGGELWTTTFKTTDTLGTTAMNWYEVLYNSGTWAISVSGSAATLTTARTIQTNLASTTAASFNGSANITPGVTGTLPIANGGTGATTAAAARTALGAGTVTSVGGTGTVSGLTLTGTVTSSGSLTLGGNLTIAADMIYNSFTATAAQTTFTTTNTYTSGKIDVFVNGVKMVNGSDVTVTSGTSVVMAAGLPVGTRVDLVYPI